MIGEFRNGFIPLVAEGVDFRAKPSFYLRGTRAVPRLRLGGFHRSKQVLSSEKKGAMLDHASKLFTLHGGNVFWSYRQGSPTLLFDHVQSSSLLKSRLGEFFGLSQLPRRRVEVVKCAEAALHERIEFVDQQAQRLGEFGFGSAGARLPNLFDSSAGVLLAPGVVLSGGVGRRVAPVRLGRFRRSSDGDAAVPAIKRIVAAFRVDPLRIPFVLLLLSI